MFAVLAIFKAFIVISIFYFYNQLKEVILEFEIHSYLYILLWKNK